MKTKPCCRPSPGWGPRAIGPLAVAALLLGACGPAGPALQLDLAVLEQDLSLRGAPAEPGVAPAGIEAFRLCVQSVAGTAEHCSDFTDMDAERYHIGGLPVGENWVVSFQGYRIESQQTTWCGRARDVRIADGQTTRVRMLLTRCGDFTQTIGQPEQARAFHTAALRSDRRLLLAGGFASHSGGDCGQPCQLLQATDSIEIYDHTTGTFGEANGRLTHARGLHAALALPDGRLLVAGGCEQASIQTRFSDPLRPGSPLRCQQPGAAATTAELFDPATGDSQVFDIPATVFAAPVAVAADELLLIGGEDAQGVALQRVLRLKVEGDDLRVQPIEQVLQRARRAATAVRFSSADAQPVEILVTGGAGAEDHSEPGLFAERLAYQDGSLVSQVPRVVEEAFNEGLPVMHAGAVRAGPGQVLVAGGLYPSRFQSQDQPFLPRPLRTAGRFDLRSDAMEILDSDSRLLEPRAMHTITAVDRHGHALVVGGLSARDPFYPLGHTATASVEWWDNAAGYFSLRWIEGQPASMAVARAGHSASLLPDGNVLVVGGTDGSAIHADAELFNPAPTSLEPGGLPPL